MCTAGTIADCVVPEYVSYYSNVYCPFAACRVSGQSYEKCQCDSYINFCGIYQNKEGYENDPKTLKYCSISTCCAKANDDTGRNTCLEGSFQNAASGAIADLVGGSTGDETSDATTIEMAPPTSGSDDVDSVASDNPGSSANTLKGAGLSVTVGAVAWLMMS